MAEEGYMSDFVDNVHGEENGSGDQNTNMVSLLPLFATEMALKKYQKVNLALETGLIRDSNSDFINSPMVKRQAMKCNVSKTRKKFNLNKKILPHLDSEFAQENRKITVA
ncbi:hypothetical protein Tco_1482558 [Tanacetum coccineum]